MRRFKRSPPAGEPDGEGGLFNPWGEAGTGMSFWELIFIIILIGVAVVALRRVFSIRATIFEYERGVLYTRGRFKKVLEPGAYWVFRPFQSVRVLDMRSKVVSVAGQEILSADNVSVKVSLAIRFRVSDPERAVQRAQSVEDILYLEAQLIIRDLISGLPIEELLQKRETLATQLRERLEPKAVDLGITLETVGIKDIMFPGGLKQIFAQVIEARKAAQASLERARGETATLRNLANAAKLLEGNPALVTLKTLQAASDGKHTLVLGVPQPFIPIPRESEIPTSPKPQIPSREPPTGQEPP